MKNKFHIVVMAVALVIMPTISFGQTAPDLGATSSFAVFTGTGALDNLGTTIVTGNVGSNAYSPTGFANTSGPGTVIGNIYNASDGITASAAADVLIAYSDLSQGGTALGVTIVDNQIITAGVWNTGAASTLNGTVYLDAAGNPNAIFIIRIGGAFSVGTTLASNIIPINSASLCNVYWQVDGAFSLSANSVFGGTVIATGAISLLEGSSLQGRALSTAGAIDLHNNVVTIPSTPNAVAGSDRAICLNESTQLGAAAVAGSTYSWTSVPAGFTSTVANPTVTPLVTTTYTVIETITATGCNSTNSVIVTVNQPPATSLIYHNP